MGLINGSKLAPSETVTNGDPPTTTANPAYFAWFRKDQMFFSWLLPSPSDEIFPYLIGLPYSFSVLSALENAFGSVSQNRQLQLHIKLQDLKHNDLSISQLLYKAKALADELAFVGRQPFPAEFNAIIYCNIGHKFHGIIIALNIKPEPVPFHELHGQLLAHEILIKSIQDSPIANIVQKAPSSTTNIKQPQPSSNYNKFSQSKCKSPRQICGYKNHTADRCRKRYTPR
ncbi:uncharacterized protein LOC110807027 [Carica papaya]|uniref:uncharacterized protein LOC110807027 n=1 Tax=Carica papaya TaxID=3649 RepID=UPI000B8C8DD7|nr:uncharacterized protein LOC110807027 [Carica papaya]